MKKILFLKLLVLVACLSSTLTLSASNYDFVVDRLAYNITSATTVEVTNPGGEGKAPDVDYSGVINIPRTATYNGTTYTVTGIGEYAFHGEPVTQVIIPNSVTYIDEYAFYMCFDLSSVSIGSGVTTIGDFAFNLCENLRYVTCRAATPPTIYGFTFKIMNGSGLGLDFVNLYVPSGSSSAYQSPSYWNQFGNINSIPSLKDALTTNSIELTSTGSYPWIVMAGVGGSYAMSGNAGVASSTSTLTGTVAVPTGGASLTFDFKAWGEGTSYDKCIFSVDGTQQFSYGARDNDWETYTVQLTAGTHTLEWKYSKDSSVHPVGDYFAVKNVKLNVEAYACWSTMNPAVLTFYCDGLRSSRTGTTSYGTSVTYDLNTGSNTPGWSSLSSIALVVFDESFANARPTSTYSWFFGLPVQNISGLSNLNTENVTNMGYMFTNCSSLTSLDVSNFNTANVTDMSYMFGSCVGLTSLDLSSFNTAKVTKMNYMFYGCNNLTTIYAGSGWSTNAVSYSSNMFTNCTKLVGGKGTTYSASNPKDKTYARIDGGTSNPGYFTEFKEAYACYTSSNTTLTFYYDGLRSSRTGTTYDLNEGEDNPGWYTDGTYANVTKVVFNSSFANARPTSTRLWFVLMSNLTSFTGLSYLNTENVTTMQSMFYGCNKFTSFDVSHFNTANVTNMNGMFVNCTSLTSLDLSNFNTSKVTNMYGLLYGCTSLTSVNLSSFNTSNVIKMGYMFYNCTSLTSLDLSNFNTAILTQTDGMFQGCRNITTIYVGSGWSTDAVTTSTGMFYSCTKLVGGKGTTYSSSHTNAAYAHIDGGPSNPGYFTASSQSGDVNGDGNVNISDVTALIDILLAGTTPPAGSDVNGDGNVNIADVTALIDMLLGS